MKTKLEIIKLAKTVLNREYQYKDFAPFNPMKNKVWISTFPLEGDTVLAQYLHKDRSISLNYSLLSKLSKKKIELIIIHEIAHAYQSLYWPKEVQIHGYRWRAITKAFGGIPKARVEV